MLVWTVLEGGFKQVQVGLDVAVRRIHAHMATSFKVLPAQP